MKVAFLITTYSRPTLCKSLVDAVKSMGDVYIVDDGSSDGYNWAKNHNYKRVKKNNGKQGYNKTVTLLWEMVKPHKDNYDYFVMIPDDFIPEPNFLKKAINTWSAISDKKKICLNLYTDRGRYGKPCWTAFNPVVFSEAIKTQWVDMCFLAEKTFFDALNWNVPEIELQWNKRPELSSGVGAWISRKLHKAGFSLWQTHTSLFTAVETNSVMNGKRKASDELINTIIPGRITAQIASVPEREDMLRQVVASLRPQVDRIFVGLNNYDHTPDFLQEGEYIHLDNTTGDAAKFYGVENLQGYFLSCDDDLVYPPGYVQYMINGLHKYGAITTLHGKEYPRPFRGVQSYIENVRCLRDAFHDVVVDVPGTGVMCLHTDMIKVRYSDFQIKNMADVWIAKLAHKQKVKIVALAHSANYLKYLNPEDTIFIQAKASQFKTESRVLQETFNGKV